VCLMMTSLFDLFWIKNAFYLCEHLVQLLEKPLAQPNKQEHHVTELWRPKLCEWTN